MEYVPPSASRSVFRGGSRRAGCTPPRWSVPPGCASSRTSCLARAIVRRRPTQSIEWQDADSLRGGQPTHLGAPFRPTINRRDVSAGITRAVTYMRSSEFGRAPNARSLWKTFHIGQVLPLAAFRWLEEHGRRHLSTETQRRRSSDAIAATGQIRPTG
ncbi:uncharacterized protein B0H18DRAFT_94958 [Fomitopsis serialis]|uniref:uncharacterized protein n=1 Tax=Fomitopsis serialis TaxID=139415 RepID=UPI00200775C2|nr:uncharacterized protein B0H18DRAFT_94958 [Neoantrodia serialis]KAH9915529.1 hypothetical protein B0H18DRAFT_94958 [Neoantrodia serialis]